MPKNADGPISGRMGFGYRAHKDAGLPFPNPRSGYSANVDIQEAAATREIYGLLKKHPAHRSWAAKSAVEGLPATNILSGLIALIEDEK